ncbi:MAG: SGNH/GDSL hydrolase family protein [Lachnospiraceae bacterium]
MAEKQGMVMKKGWKAFICLGMMVCMLAGCGGQGSGETDAGAQTNTDDTVQSVTDDTETLPDGTGEASAAGAEAVVPPLTDYVSAEEMERADMWGSCDDTALAAVMRKAAAGEKVTIACIGGSITQGTISNGSDDSEVGFKKCYADIFFEWWENTFPQTEFEFINAGIGATDSYLGVHRVQKDVLDYDPDLVLVEFSVNDSSSTVCKTTYDNLVRKILKSDSNPAVMLLFMGQTNGATAQDVHVLIGFNYKLPMVSYINVINDMMLNQVYTDKQLSGDVTHPSALGHAITGEILWKYLNSVYEQMDTFGEPQPFDEKPVTYEAYMDAQILDSLTITPDEPGTFSESSKFTVFPNDWTCEEGEGNLTFTVNCRNIGILYYQTIDGNSGQFEIYVDGECVRTLNADFYGGWGNHAEAAEVYSSDEAAQHTIVIKKAPDSTGDVFTLLGLMIS